MLKVLSVDDREENRYMLEVLLRAAGFEVHSAENGVEALAMLERQPFDLIISDILMPQMDGFQLCREVKRRSRFQKIPFVFYSATYTEEKDRELALSLGACQFIVKPAEPEKFQAVIQHVVESCREGHAPVLPPPPEEREEEFLKLYNQRLVNKLEQKIASLEAATEELERALRLKDREMAERKLAEEALRASEARYRLIADHMGDLVWLWLLDSDRLAYVSPSVERLRGFTPAEVMAQPLAAAVVPESWEEIQQLLRERISAFEGGDESARYAVVEVLQPRKDGSVVPTEAAARLMTDDSGRVIGVLGVTRDITLRKRYENELRALNTHLEQKVRERTAQVEASNRELEAFGYSMSHDLKAPLRAIKGFSLALKEDHGQLLPPDGRDLLAQVIAESRRLEDLIDDLHRLARVGHQELNFESVDVTGMVEAIARILGGAEPERKVRWEVEPGLRILGDPALVRVLLDNLLANAWKFTAGVEDARIQVVRSPAEPGWDGFLIEDNGVGFDPSQGDRLFIPFQRLHAYDAFPGTGIGLAIVHRIATRHGAQVSLQGRPGQGATVHLLFPAPWDGPEDARP